ncbi:class I SAM-dependent methyltransferase [Tellurirhabdus rosea]|uniref:class I SAM-dependent methyltransferase n=1 Tax=Tellurirhabdus rosea TaxID=2674997 RepID=UPI002251213F|nr:class I SAM-dependent methyltransferase [Tellurirhabdus rosea]
MAKPVISSSVQEAYAAQYTSSDRSWRDLGGKQKAENIARLCQKRAFGKVLDVGSGDGAVLQWLDRMQVFPAIQSLEISESGIEGIRARNLKSVEDVRLFDGYTIPHGDKAFPLATCSHVLEHVEHPRLLLREIARVSEFQFFEVPIDFSLFVDQKVEHFLAYGHINIFTPALFKFLLKTEGFEVLDELFAFYDPEVLKRSSPSPVTYWSRRLKSAVLEAVPLFRKVKPNAYAVLCRHSGALRIF